MNRIAFLFPGQGSQTVRMGRSLYDTFAVSRQVFEEADDALGFALSKLIFEGPEDQLKLTENTQPAILTVSVAAERALAERGIKAEFAAGHSLGEYSAHVAAGTFSFADAVRTVRNRGRYMQEAVPEGEGAMADFAREWIGGLDFVSREEFEAVKAMAAAARDEAEALKARLDAVEGKAAKPAPRPKSTKA